LASRLIQGLEQTDPEAAIARALEFLARVGGEAGLIVIDNRGRVGWGHNSAQFAVAHATSLYPPRAFVARAEDDGAES
ncbi:MAG TPA: hypothetical protein VN158_03390, partial [Caulobacter sp.]|nr:hypothetical protein [Caulobacter sp.]